MVMEKKDVLTPKKDCSMSVVSLVKDLSMKSLMELLRYVLWILFIQCCCICLFMVKSNLNQLIFCFRSNLS